MSEDFPVVVGAGSARSTAPGVVVFPHRWTAEGVTVEADFTGAHLLHLAAAGCVLNDVYREAETLGVDVVGVRVVARGGFDTGTWASTGVTYEVAVDSPASAPAVAALLARVDEWPRSRERSGEERRCRESGDRCLEQRSAELIVTTAALAA